MLIVRRIDLWMQVLIVLTSLIYIMSPLALAGFLGILGIWQVSSALFNTHGMYKSAYRKKIRLYWILTFTDLGMLCLAWEDAWILGATAMVGSVGIAVYYWCIYRSFINYLSYRKELSTIVRNKQSYHL